MRLGEIKTHIEKEIKYQVITVRKYMRKKSLGMSTLEMLVAAPILLSAVVGVVSVGRIYQTHTSLKEGVRQAVRCVYPTDPKCVEVLPATANIFYDWYKINTDVNFEIDQYDYSGIEKWFNVPTYNYEGFQAKILNNVTALYPQRNYSAKKVGYQVNGVLNYVVEKTRLPRAVGTVGVNPSFVYQAEPTKNYSPTISQGISNLSLIDRTNPATTDRDEIEYTFRINRPWADSNLLLLKSNAGYDTSSASGRGYGALTNADDVPIAIHLRGTVSGRGRILMSVISSNGTQNLNGKVFSGAGNGNLIPRGIPTGYYDQALTVNPNGGIYQEWAAHQSVEVPFNEDFKIKLKVIRDSDSSSANWRGNDLRIWTPQYSVESENKNCGIVSRSDYQANGGEEKASNCRIDGLEAEDLSGFSVDTSRNFDETPPINLGCVLNSIEANDSFANIQSEDTESFDVTESSVNSCNDLEVRSECPEFGASIDESHGRNYGVTELANSEGRIYSSASAQSICPIDDDERVQTYSVTPRSIFWTEKTVDIEDSEGNPVEVSYTKEDCRNQFQLPAQLINVPESKRIIPNPEVGSLDVFTNEEDPDELKATNTPKYGCSEVQVKSRIFNDREVGIPETSLFFGTRDDLGDACWEDQIRDEAEHLGKQPDSFFKPENRRISARIVEEEPSASCEIPARIVYDSSPSEELVASDMPQGETPSECLNSEVICRSVLSGFVGNPNNEIRENFAAAESFGFREIKAMVPTASKCTDSSDSEDCVKIKVETQEINGKKYYQASASTQLKLPFGFNTTVSTSETERSERDL